MFFHQAYPGAGMSNWLFFLPYPVWNNKAFAGGQAKQINSDRLIRFSFEENLIRHSKSSSFYSFHQPPPLFAPRLHPEILDIMGMNNEPEPHFFFISSKPGMIGVLNDDMRKGLFPDQ